MPNHKSFRPGASILDEAAHAREHHVWSRRDFLTTLGLFGAGSFALGGSGVGLFAPSPLLASLAASETDRVLVLIRLDGGNDGLNTVIERGNPHYYNLRPTIGIPDTGLWHLNNELGMPLATSSLEPMWQEGMMKVLLNVGYPQPNYSHFRSYDIVASGSASNTVWNTGWLGRLLDEQLPAFLDAPPTVPPALLIGVQANLVFQADAANLALSVSSPQQFYQIAQSGQLYGTDNLGATPHETELLFMRQTANAAFRYADSIRDAFNRGKNQVTYPSGNSLATQLAIVAKLIKANLGTKIFMVQIGGFDTHADQGPRHTTLMTRLSQAVRAFYDDLAYGGNTALTERVLSMTFSEFGRTIYENGSVGTDHGWGTHYLMFGGGLGQGVAGTYQDLSNPDPYDDPPFSLDFRDVYASVLSDWLGSDPALVGYVMGQQTTVEPIPGLIPAGAVPQGVSGECVLLGHNRADDDPQTVEIKYAMMTAGNVRLQLLDNGGQVLRTLVNEYQAADSYTFRFKPAEWFVTPGEYQYRVMTGGRVVQRKLTV